MKFGRNFAFNQALDEMNYEGEVATKKGIAIKSVLLLFIMLISATFMISNFHRFGSSALLIYGIVAIVNIVLQLIICFNPAKTKVLSFPFVIFEGFMIGTLVGLLEYLIPGEGLAIAGLALIMTISIFLASSILYLTGVIKPNRFFLNFIVSVMGGICICSLIVCIISLFNPSFYMLIFYNQFSIVFSVIMVIIAGLYCVISLDNASRIVDNNAPKFCEWQAAFGIVLNVEWLFLEIFRLLIKLLGSRKK